jgi:hypothetical protein
MGETTEEKVEECECPIELQPMEEWLVEEDPNFCRPCLLAPLTAWYKEALEEAGRQDLSDKMVEVAENLDAEDSDQVLTYGKQLDTIKESVEGPLRERLKVFDCYAQTYDPNEAVDE